MNIKLLWKADGFVCLLAVVVFLLSSNSDLMQTLERKAYDLGMHISSHTPSDKVVVIAIDDQSVANLGRWPWPRGMQAKMLDILAAAHAKVIGQTSFFFESQADAGLDYLYKIAALLDVSSLKSSTEPRYQAELGQLVALLREAEQTLDNDKILHESIKKANNILLAMVFEWGETQGKQETPLPVYLRHNNLNRVKQADGLDSKLVSATSAQYPIEELGASAVGVGHLSVTLDVDGGVRTEPLVVDYFGQHYPSLSLLLAAKSLNLGINDIKVTLGEGVKLGPLAIATDPDLRMHTYFYSDKESKPAFQVDSFYDVLNGKIPLEKYRDKIVLLGVTATGLGAMQVTPISSAMAPVLTLAHSVSSILQQDFFVVPVWSTRVQYAVFLFVAVYLVVLLPRLKARLAATITVLLLAVVLFLQFWLMIKQGVWLQLMLPASLLLTGYILLVSKRFILAENSKMQSAAELAETNRMLGLAFQGQGQLDMAFDKFKKVRRDDSLMEVLYDLGLDFERNNQFNKAESVFKYMAEYNPKFRDLENRLAVSDI